MVTKGEILARALRDLNLVSMSKFTLKPKQESVVIALSVAGAVYDSFACRIREVSNTSKLKGKYNHCTTLQTKSDLNRQ